jgi:predicted nucleotidyltransferase
MKLADVEAILRALNDAEVRYLIVGGLAVIAHGYIRLTVDVDIVLNLQRDNVLRALQALEKIDYRPLVPLKQLDFANEALRESWRKEKNMVVFQMMNLGRPSTKLDIFVTEPFDFEREYGAAKWEKVAGIRSPVVRIEALIEMKEKAGRGKDVGDLGELRKLLDIERDERSNR